MYLYAHHHRISRVRPTQQRSPSFWALWSTFGHWGSFAVQSPTMFHIETYFTSSGKSTSDLQIWGHQHQQRSGVMNLQVFFICRSHERPPISGALSAPAFMEQKSPKIYYAHRYVIFSSPYRTGSCHHQLRVC